MRQSLIHCFSGVVEAGPTEWRRRGVGTGGELEFSVDGTHAERLAFPVSGLVRKPQNLGHEIASAIGVTFLVAWLGLADLRERAGR